MRVRENSALYVVDPQVAEKPSEQIVQWVQHAGGHVILTGVAATLNESNSTNLAMRALLSTLDRDGGTYRHPQTYSHSLF